MGYLDNWKNIRKNWNTIRKNPYAYQKLYYYFYTGVLVLIAIVMAINIISIFMSYSARGPMSIVGRTAVLLIMALFMFRLWSMKNQAKKILLHYESSPTTIEDIPQNKNVDVVKEVDDILNKYDKVERGSKK